MVTQQKSERTSLRGKPPVSEDEFAGGGQVVVPSNGGGNGHAVAATKETMPDWMQSYKSEGLGVSEKAKDNLVPLAILLQTGRKEANSSDTKYIPGAEVGMVWIAALTEQPLIDLRKGVWGNKTWNANGLLVQRVHERHGIFEWGVPRGTGFKGFHPLVNDDADATMKALGARQVKVENDKLVWRNGNREFVETRVDTLLLHVEEQDENGNWRRTGEILPISIAFDSQEHSFAKDWNSQIRRKRLPNGQKADGWLSMWRLTVFYHAPGNFSYYKWQPDFAGWVFDVTGDPEHVELGKTYYQALVSGEKDIEAPTDDGGNGANYASDNVHM